jgi:hypothetical protein
MPVGLESLQMSDERRAAAQEEIQRNAYFKWQNAGCPEGDSMRFWREAEYEWIEFNYVPDRAVEFATKSREAAAEKNQPRTLARSGR